MTTLSLDIGGRLHDVTVRGGQEAKFRALAALVDARCRDAARSAGGLTEARQLLFAALMLADDVQEADARTAAAEAHAVAAPGLIETNEALRRDAAAARADGAAIEAQAEALLARYEALAAENEALVAELAALREAPPPAPDPAAMHEAAIVIENLAERIEAYADGLEAGGLEKADAAS